MSSSDAMDVELNHENGTPSEVETPMIVDPPAGQVTEPENQSTVPEAQPTQSNSEAQAESVGKTDMDIDSGTTSSDIQTPTPVDTSAQVSTKPENQPTPEVLQPNQPETKAPESKVRLVFPHQLPNWGEIVAKLNSSQITTGAELNALISDIGRSRISVFTSLFRHDDKFSEQGVEFTAAELFSTVRTHALEAPFLFSKEILPLLPQKEGSITLTKRQVACLLACSFLGMISPVNYPKGFQWPCFDITSLFAYPGGSGSMYNFVVCIVHYFYRLKTTGVPRGDLILTRKVLRHNVEFQHSKKKICEIEVTNELIEKHYSKKFHADFANKYIGGGVLDGGSVQEEILFVIKPECLVSLFLCTMMEANEAIIVSGAEQFSSYKGYAYSFVWAGDFKDPTPFNEKLNCIDNHIVAIDAVVARGGNDYDFQPKQILRDITKAYIGICNPEKFCSKEDEYWFVTGNWGCGAFGGDLELKACQQIVAASEAGVGLVYSTFGKKTFSDSLQQLVTLLKSSNITSGDLAGFLLTYEPGKYSRRSVFEYVQLKILETQKSQQAPDSQVKEQPHYNPFDTQVKEQHYNPFDTQVKEQPHYNPFNTTTSTSTTTTTTTTINETQPVPGDTAGNEPPSTTAGSEPPSTTAGNEPPSTTAGNEPPSTTAGNEPPSTTAGNEPPSTTAGSEPPSTTAGNEPPSTTATTGSEPPSTTAGNEPTSTTAGNEPTSTTAGNEPTSTTAGNEPPSTTAGSEPPSTTALTESPGDTVPGTEQLS